MKDWIWWAVLTGLIAAGDLFGAVILPRQIPNVTAFTTNLLTAPDAVTARGILGLTGSGTNQSITFNGDQIGNDAQTNKVIIEGAPVTNLVLRGGNTRITPTGATHEWALEDRFGERRHVKDFNAVCDGVTDDSAAVAAAVAALGARGGDVVFPPGLTRFNLTLTTNYNVHLVGAGSVRASNGGDVIATAFVPADTNRPVVQVGDDSHEVRGFMAKDCTFYGGTNTAGCEAVRFAGGTYEAWLNRVTLLNFKTNISFIGGTNFPVSKVWVNDFASQNDDGARGVFASWGTAAGYVTAIYFAHGGLDSPTGAGTYALESDGVVIDWQQVYMGASGGDGILLNHSFAGAYVPYLSGSGNTLDSTGTVVKLGSSLGGFANIASWPQWLHGGFEVNSSATLETADGTTLDGFAPFEIPSGAEALDLLVSHVLYLDDYTARTGGGAVTQDRNAKIFRSGGTVWVQNDTGGMVLLPSGQFSLAPQGTNGEAKINGGAVGLTLDASTKGLGQWIGSLVVTNGDLVLTNGQFYIGNNKSLFFVTPGGTAWSAMALLSSTNLSINSPADLLLTATSGRVGVSGGMALTGGLTVAGTQTNAGSIYLPAGDIQAQLNARMTDPGSNGLLARTGSGTAAARTITGDTEAVVSNGNGVSGNPTLSIGAGITRYAGITNFTTFALSDLTTALTTGTSQQYWRTPFACTIKAVSASLLTASGSGDVTVDINKNGSTIFSTRLSIDAGEKTSATAATPAVLSDTALGADDEVTFDIDGAGSSAAGLQVKIFYTRP